MCGTVEQKATRDVYMMTCEIRLFTWENPLCWCILIRLLASDTLLCVCELLWTRREMPSGADGDAGNS